MSVQATTKLDNKATHRQTDDEIQRFSDSAIQRFSDSAIQRFNRIVGRSRKRIKRQRLDQNNYSRHFLGHKSQHQTDAYNDDRGEDWFTIQVKRG
ncbi:hypothetical protein A0E43_07605 [Pectobacterium cacticida]